MTSAFTSTDDSRAQLFEKILANWIGHKGQWLNYYPGLLEALTAVRLGFQVSWPKIITEAEISFIL